MTQTTTCLLSCDTLESKRPTGSCLCAFTLKSLLIFIKKGRVTCIVSNISKMNSYWTEVTSIYFIQGFRKMINEHLILKAFEEHLSHSALLWHQIMF